MLVWLASYPRSGNHLLRSILQRSFDLGSYEIYQKGDVPSEGPWRDVIGVRGFDDADANEFIKRARNSSDPLLVKSHDPVPRSDHCIYVVRDARAALVSYRRFLAEVEGVDVSIENLIAGNQWPGRWDKHVEMFLARDPTNTLILRYEDLASDEPPLEQIGAFLQRPVARKFDVSFASIHEISSKMFPTGNNRAGIATIERDYGELFWSTLGETMRRLGYGQDEAGSAPLIAQGSGMAPMDGDWAVGAGFDQAEGPFPEQGLSFTFHWSVEPVAVLEVYSAHAGRRVLTLDLVSSIPGQIVSVRAKGGDVRTVKLSGNFPRAEKLTIRHDFEIGPCQLEISVDRLSEASDGRKLGVILKSVRLGVVRRRWFRSGFRTSRQPA